MLEKAVAAEATHEKSLALDLLAVLTVLAGERPPPATIGRRDRLWEQLGVIAAPSYLSLPRLEISSGRS